MLPSHTIKAFFGQTTSLRLYGQQSLQPFTAAIPLGPAIISCHECLLALGCFLPRIERGVPSPSMERHLRPPLRGGYSRVNKGRKPSDEMFISVFETFHLAGSLDNFISSRILHAAALACVCIPNEASFPLCSPRLPRYGPTSQLDLDSQIQTQSGNENSGATSHLNTFRLTPLLTSPIECTPHSGGEELIAACTARSRCVEDLGDANRVTS